MNRFVLLSGMVAGAATMAMGSSTVLSIRASLDGVNWHSSVGLTEGGQAVYFGYFISFHGTPGQPVPNAFANISIQPVFSGVRPGIDSVGDFATWGRNTNGGAIDPRASYGEGTGGYGRIKPWASTGPISSQPYAVHTHTGGSGGAPAGNYFRIARNDITRWAGLGPTTGTAALNNFNGAGGVVVAQLQRPTPSDPPRIAGTSELLVMVLKLNVGLGAWDSPSIVATVPREGVSRFATTGERVGSWWANTTENAPSIRAGFVVQEATVYLPAPGSITALGFIVAATTRRRQR